MNFGRLAVADAAGAILGHGVEIAGRRLKKGHVLTTIDVSALQAAGIVSVLAGRLAADDVGEDQAAGELADALAGPGARAGAPFTGRANLHAETSGLAGIDLARIAAINLIDEAITVATVPAFDLIDVGTMLATVKIIPFAVSRAVLDHAIAAARGPTPAVAVSPFVRRHAGLILTRLPDTADKLIAKAERSVRDRLDRLGTQLDKVEQCAHREDEIAAALKRQAAMGLDPILIFGASAIVDRQDVVPAAIDTAGGTVVHFGMPVDPGNLLLLGQFGAATVIGVPGCARSPKLNGFDFVLRRAVAGLTVTRADIMAMGGGGLLKEITTRPQPRDVQVTAPRLPKVAAVILAAGRSTRMGSSNKLLEPLGGKPLVCHAVDAAINSSARPVVVVTGHQRDAVQAALAGRPVTLVDNPDYQDGLSSSLKAGLAALPVDCDGALVCLGDMPKLTANHLDRLIAAFNPVEGRAIILPTRGGRRGNPVLWAAHHFPAMRDVAGDIGARHLIGEHDDEVCEVAFDDDAALVDVDTPAALAAVRAEK